MKKLLSVFVVGAALSLFASCQKETGSGGPGTIPQSVLNQFASLYPTATNVQWTTKGNDYAIATFTLTNTKANGAQNSAWFALQSGSWGMTETEILFDQLPEAVKTAFNASEYAQAPWYLDDQEIDVIYRGEGQETLYVIEVEQRDNNQTIEMKLYYTADGTLTKEFGKEEDYSGYFPQQLPTSIESWIATNYPGATIIEIDHEGTGYEAEIYHEGIKYDIVFTANSEWSYTETDYERSHLSLIPQGVRDAVDAQYNSSEWRIDDVKKYVSTTVTYYIFELERTTGRDDEQKVYVMEDGTLSLTRPGYENGAQGDAGAGIPVGEDISAFIAENYPGASVIERDYDKGYQEIEIWHDNVEKTLKFTSSNAWVSTEYDLRQFNQLPQNIQDALTADAEFVATGVEDIEVTELANGTTTYEVEVKSGRLEITFRVDGNGNISKEYDD